MREKFVQGPGAEIPADGGEIFHLMEFFAGCRFNKSHSAAYALIACWTAFFSQYPQAFMAATTSVMGIQIKSAFILKSAGGWRIPIFRPT